MAGFSKGDRVLLLESIGTGFFSSIEKGTEGTVMEEPGMLGGSYLVRFDDGSEEYVSGDLLGAGSDPRR